VRFRFMVFSLLPFIHFFTVVWLFKFGFSHSLEGGDGDIQYVRLSVSQFLVLVLVLVLIFHYWI
jgi:hypothetical protein